MKLFDWYSVISIVGGPLLYQIVFYLFRLWVKHKKRALPELLNRYIYYPGMFLTCTIASSVALVFFESHLTPKLAAFLEHLIHILIIAGTGFLLIRILSVFKELTIRHYTLEETGDYRLRKVSTKFQLLQRVINFVIILLTTGAILMTFQGIRQVGGTILASAGVVGLIVGFAAQKSIGSLFAGIQIAISQPIRLDDIVVVDGHFGRVAEITLTYVIIDKMDGRRLTVPINHFLENTFENWTRTSADVVAKIFLYVDYTIPVEEIRKVFLGWLEETELWDKRKARFLVTDTTAATIELRGTATTRNSDDSFDLECLMREKLIAYIQQHYPDALPRTRIVISGDKP
jgi:small-conductance mechanosensitive channel